MSAALAVVNPTSNFAAAPADAWFASYDPGEGNLTLHFKHDLKGNTEVLTIGKGHDKNTGAKWYVINGSPRTLENVRTMKPFTVVLSTYHVGPGYGYWVCGQDNTKPLGDLFSALGDTASAQKLRDNFPTLFNPPMAVKPPQPTPMPAPAARKGIFRRRK